MVKHADGIVAWSESYNTGIKLIDNQHKELVNLTNKLYQACLSKDGEEVFKDTMSNMVDYVRFHFTAELELLERVNYPGLSEHREEHKTLTKNILGAVKDYTDGKKFVPNTFVRTLKDWILGHIAVSDKLYATYIADQKKKGILGDDFGSVL